jgi:hypothetical protein
MFLNKEARLENYIDNVLIPCYHETKDRWYLEEVARKLLLLTSILATPVWAADLPTKSLPYCGITSCTGFYIGGHVEGTGQSALPVDVSSGAGIGLHAGYQLWNGSLFAAVEVGGTYYTGTNTVSEVYDPRWSVDYLAKVGYGLQGLFNTGATAPSQGPVLQQLNAALISPYAIVGGRTRDQVNGFVSGAGAEYTIGRGWNAYAEYLHVNYHQAIAPGVVIETENLVRAGINRKF